MPKTAYLETEGGLLYEVFLKHPTSIHMAGMGQIEKICGIVLATVFQHPKSRNTELPHFVNIIVKLLLSVS